MLGHHPSGTNTVLNGPLAGTDLGTVCRRYGEAVLGTRAGRWGDAHGGQAHGSKAYGGEARGGAERLPLLVKLLDARDKLSVQVHPADGDPTLAPGESGKTEMWYVLDAEPGATIIYGLRDGVGAREFAQAIEAGRVADCLQQVPVQAGDAFLIPAGTIHALGAGVLVAEIQQSSDTTYRVHDYGRPGLDGRPRELHIREALQVTRYRMPEPVRRAEASRRQGEPSLRQGQSGQRQAAGAADLQRWIELSRSDHFVVEKGLCQGEWVEETSRETFQALLVVSGHGRLEWDAGPERDAELGWRGGVVPLTPGQAVLLPATLGPYALHGEMEVLRAWLPAVG